MAINVVKPICDAVGIDYHLYREFKGEGQGVLASVNSKIRMSESEWKAFNGLCGHQHVPNNDHWDPGRIDYKKIIAILEK